MEDVRSSRRPARSSYGEVFSGPLKLSSAPLGAKPDVYAEVFGGISASCSIPFLDLPPSSDDLSGEVLIDYLEIFGRSNGGGDFAVDYEDLFGDKKKTTTRPPPSKERVQMDAKFDQHAEVSNPLPEGTDKDYVDWSEKDSTSSSSNRSDDGSKRFSMSYHRTNHSSIEDVISGETHVTRPGYTYTVNSCSSQDVRGGISSNIQTNDLTYNVRYNGQSSDLEPVVVPFTSSTDNIESDVANLRTHEEYRTGYAAFEVDHVNTNHHSRSSSYHSASSGDIPCPAATYASTSDINLQTEEPSRVPSPSKPLPKVVSKQESIKRHHISYKIGASKSHVVQGVLRDSSSGFLGVEVDASLAAAASAAAMKEAMEQAQARLKSAKELMERKRDKLHSRKKLGINEGVNYNEKEEGKASIEGKSFREVASKKNLSNKDNGTKEYALDDIWKVIKAGKATPDHEEKERYVVSAAQGHRDRQHNGFKSSLMCYKSEEVSGEWKTEEQFYELVSNEKKSRVVKEASKQDIEEKPEATTKIYEIKENYPQNDELVSEFKRNVDLHKVSEPIKDNEIGDNSKACNLINKEEIRKTPEEVPQTCVLKGNNPEEFPTSRDQIFDKKLQTSQDALSCGEEVKKPNINKEAFCGQNEMNMVSSSNALKLEEICHNDEVNRQLHTAEEGTELIDNEKKLSGTNVTCASHEGHEKLKMFRRRVVQYENENENEMKANSRTFLSEADFKTVELEEAHQDANPEHARVNNKEIDSELEGTNSDVEHRENRKLNGAENACILPKKDRKSGVAQDSDEGKSSSSLGDTVDPEAQAVQQNRKKQNADQEPPMVENNEGALRGDPAKCENGSSKESNAAIGSEKPHHQVGAAQEIFHRATGKNVEGVPQGSRGEKEDLRNTTKVVCQISQSSSLKPPENSGNLVSQKSNTDLHKREKLESEKTSDREREHEQEQARKLEEEKQREREREKDRLAVERATREARERARAEAREKAERIAVERITAEARQRAFTEAREKAELEKSLTEKALKEAKLRAERAAVERATAEARARAVEKALAEKAAADARKHAERFSAISRDKGRKDNETGEHFRANDKEDKEIKLKSNSSDAHDVRFQSAGSSASWQRHTDSSARGEVASPLRCKARLERHQRTVERAAKALAEKNMRDILAQREQAERNRLAETLDADVRRWSTGKEGNLRALLSTLQYILGPESGWQPVPLTDVITAAAVKKAYRKATLCVHPDKLQQRGASIQQKYICEKVFDLLKEAWNRFNSEER